jgi:DNA segregation ATPase FtsK/SpoIIIE, S-DNA-T family
MEVDNMIFSIASSILLGSVALYAQTKKSGGTSDAAKIQKILNNCGLIGRDGETCQMLRKRPIKDPETKKVIGTVFVIRHPLGLCEDDFRKNLKRLQDGLNIKGNQPLFSLNDLKELKLNKEILKQIRQLTKKERTKRKEIELEYDGSVKILVYNSPMTTYEEYTEPKGKGWTVPVGVDRLGKTIYHDFDDEPHFLIGGATGGGKSNFLNLLISNFLYTKTDHIKLSLIDLKGGVEFEGYRDCKQVVGYAEEPKEAYEVLQNVMAYIDGMKVKLKKMGYRNVIEAGIKERHFLVIDEIAELSPEDEVTKKAKKNEEWTDMDYKENCWFLINKIARQGRSWGVKCVSATQHPIQKNVPDSLKRNSEGKLCFLVEDAVASRVVLDSGGAESLPDITGRALYKKGAKITEVQTLRIKDDKIQEAVTPNIVFKAKIDPVQEVKTHEQKAGGNLTKTKSINDLIKATTNTNF